MATRSELFGDADYDRVKQSVRNVEARTSAEILPVVARSSGRYDRPEDIVGVWLAGVAMIVAWFAFPLPQAESGNWETSAPVWQLVVMLTAALVGYITGAVLGSKIDVLRRLFTSRAQMRDEVYRRAREVFFDQRVHHTRERDGILLYVSLFEHMVAVIADQNILDKLGQDYIDQVCADFSGRLRQDTPVNALCQTIDSIGEKLASSMPRGEEDVNELSDALIVIN